MTSKIIVNTIEGDVGVSSVTFNDTIYGNLEGNVTGDITATSGTFSGNVSIDGTLSGISSVSTTNLSVNNNVYPSAGSLGKRNLIINGSFMVSQRATSVTFSNATAIHRTVDRFSAKFFGGGWGSNHSTESQSTDAPPGHSYSYKVLAEVAQDYSSSLGSWIQYSFEGNQLLPLKTANLGYKEFTVSFWIKSNKTGNVSVCPETSGKGHGFSTIVQINSANTWEYKTVTFPASPSSQLTEDEFRDNEAEFNIKWGLGSNGSWLVGTDGSWQPYATNRGVISSLQTNFQESVNDYLAIGGIQMEVGSNATEFEYRTYDEELALCQRYFQGWNATSTTERAKTGIFVYDFEGNNSANQATVLGTGSVVDADDARIEFSLPVSMREKPTTSVSDLRLITGSTLHNSSTTVQYNNSTIHSCSMMLDNGGGMTAKQCAHLIIKGNGYFYLDAEL